MLDIDVDLLTNWRGPDTATLRAAQRPASSDLSAEARALLLEVALRNRAAGLLEASAAPHAPALATNASGSGLASTEQGDLLAQLAALLLSPDLDLLGASASVTQPGLAAYCLGSFRLFYNLKMVSPWPSRKGLAVLEYLIVHHPTPAAKEVLMDLFWPDDDAVAARRNLHQAIYAVRRVFAGHGLGPQWLQFGQDHYFLDPGVDLWLDIVEFEKHIQAGRRLEILGQMGAAMTEYEVAQGLYQGDLLEDDLYEDWLRWKRETLRNAYLDIADRLSEHYLQQQKYSAAMTLSWRVLTFDHCHEQAHCRLMKCYTAQGQRHMAVRQYQLCADALRADLDLAPSEETTALYHQLVDNI